MALIIDLPVVEDSLKRRRIADKDDVVTTTQLASSGEGIKCMLQNGNMKTFSYDIFKLEEGYDDTDDEEVIHARNGN